MSTFDTRREQSKIVFTMSALYSELMEFESRVDAALARKEIDIQDAMKNLAVDSVGTPTPHERFEVKRKKISHHLSSPQPIHLEHKIKLSGNSPVGGACYDVLVDVPFFVQMELNALLATTEKAKDTEACR
ncbi:hypothetical protein Tco_1429850 [Tanacetum coccineum]